MTAHELTPFTINRRTWIAGHAFPELGALQRLAQRTERGLLIYAIVMLLLCEVLQRPILQPEDREWFMRVIFQLIDIDIQFVDGAVDEAHDPPR